MPIPTGPHSDWIWPFSLIPRKWTAIPRENPPLKLMGTAPPDKPIPDPGDWIINYWPPYFAFQTKGGWHFRIGARWDNVDKYVQFPSFKIGKYSYK